MPHPNEALVRKVYETFSKGDLPGVLAMCDESITFTVPGAVPFAGTYNLSAFPGLVMRLMELSGGSFGEALIDVVANDDHAVAILDHWLERDGKRIEYRTDHIWGIRDGKFTSWLERPGNQAEFERAWS